MLLGDAESPELVEDGLIVQYFENGRLEYHPQNPPESRVLLSEFGLRYGASEPPAAASLEPGAVYFPETGHNLHPVFAPFYLINGGEQFFGPPISEIRLDHGRLMQFFTRAVLYREEDDPTGQSVRMARLGSLAYDGATLGSADIGVQLPPAEIPHRPFDAFVAAHGGERVFGRALSLPHDDDQGRLAQVYERAVFFADPARPGGVALAQLGLAVRAPDPPVPPLSDLSAIYFPEYGHNVVHAFAGFFSAHGGPEVFGYPTSEILLEGDLLVQYFENARFEWHPGVPASVALQLTAYGPQYLPTPPPQPSAAEAMGALSVTAWAEHPILPLQNEQTIHVRAQDASGGPVIGAVVIVSVRSSADSFSREIPPTDTEGVSEVTFGLPNTAPGDFVVFEVAVLAPGRVGYHSSSFVTWFGVFR